MNIDYIKQIMDEELGNEFLLDQNSLFRGKLVYYVPRTHISLEQIQRKKEELYNRYRIVTALESDNMYYILRVLGVAQEKPHKTKIWLHAILVLLTVFTTSAAGALLRGHLFWEGWRQFLIGLIPDRKALLKIGIMGPIAGFILTLIFLIVGYATLPDVEGIRAYIETIHPLNGQPEPGTNLILGKSVLIWFFNDVIAGGRLPMNEMYHFPFIFAGWVGLLVTAINLMPIGQLDGGHISYALFGPKAKYISFLTFGMLILLNFFSLNYLIWTLLIFFIVKFRHPPTLNDYIPLSRTERILGYVGYIIFIISFIPMPLMIT